MSAAAEETTSSKCSPCKSAARSGVGGDILVRGCAQLMIAYLKRPQSSHANANANVMCQSHALLKGGAPPAFPMHPLTAMARIPNKDRISSVQQMPKLRPSSMWPRRHATVANALAALAQIDFVEFAHTKKVHGTQVFVLNVYLKRKPNRIPTNRSSRNESIAWTDRNKRNTLTPDYQLEKTLSDLQTLRYYSYDYAQQRNNDFVACEYCAAFYALTHKHYSNAKLLALLWPSAAHRKTVIEGFVNGMVALSVDGLSSLQRTRGCSSFANIPVRIQRFLSQRQRGYGSF